MLWESRESKQRKFCEGKTATNRETKMSCFKGVDIKNYTENRARLP